MTSILALHSTSATSATTSGQPLIAVGTRVSTVLYNRGEGFVTAIHGAQRPRTVRSLGGGVAMTGGGAEFDIVFLSGSFTRRLPECILRGVQWRILDRYGSEAEIAAAAANLRLELRCAFPGVKFSVRVPHHGSICVRWTGGPTRQEVEAIANRYQGGHFDGMKDIYRSQRSPWCEVFEGADYVCCSREGG